MVLKDSAGEVQGETGVEGGDTGREKEESMEESVHWGTSAMRMKLSSGVQTRLSSELVPPTPLSYTETTSSFLSALIALPVFLMENSQALAEWPEEAFVVPSPITGLWLRHS